MALTVSNLVIKNAGSQKMATALITFDTLYATGGESLTARQLGLNKIASINIDDSEGYTFDGDIATGGASVLLKAYRSGGFTPAGTVSAPIFTGSALGTHQHDAISAGTPAGTNAASDVQVLSMADLACCTAPVITLTHNADPVAGLSAAPLYGIEGSHTAVDPVITLTSTTAANANVLGETANGVGGGAAASCRFFVLDDDTPAGVPIYINEAANDQLECVSPTGKDGYIIMPYEAVAGAIPGFAVAVTVHHNADAANGKPLYFDDNGAADAQLVFVDTGASGGVIPAADIEVIAPAYAYSDGMMSQAAAQTFTGSALGTHQHAAITAGTPAGTNSVPTFTGTPVSATSLVEVALNTNLSAVAVNVTAMGY